MAEKRYTGIAPLRIVVDDITKITPESLDDLECGDLVVKHTIQDGKDLYHTYIVSHKQATGICMTYSASGYLETVSYDKIDGEWTYNSTDVWQAEA